MRNMALFPRLRKRLRSVLGQVEAPPTTIIVHPIPVPVLSIQVDKTVGYLGDTFTFSGSFTQDGSVVDGSTVTLYRGAVLVGTDITDAFGKYSIPWVANVTGTITFYTEAPTPAPPPL